MPWNVDDVNRFKQGLSDAKKRQWVEVANSVLSNCLSDGGNQQQCEASAIRQANGAVQSNKEQITVDNTDNSVVQFNQTSTRQNGHYDVRYENHQGKRHLIVPVVMMKEGVHCGSHGAVYHTPSELSKYPESWNGIPVVVGHPEENGSPVSANMPEIVDSAVVGRVYHAHYKEGLRAEAWLDESRLRANHQELIDHFSNGLPLDVSVGAFTDDEPVIGEWNGETYSSISHNYRPDHLALIPYAQGQGACSWEDGCGVRVNNMQTNGGSDMDKKLWMGLLLAGYKATEFQPTEQLQSNEMGYQGILQLIQRKLDSMDNDVKMHFLEELYDDYFIYRISTDDSNPTRYYRRDYVVGNDGTSVTFGDEVNEVRKKVDYVDAEQQTNSFVRTKKPKQEEEKNMAKEKEEVQANAEDCGCPDKVAKLLQTDAFDEKDKEWLESIPNENLDKFISAMEAREVYTNTKETKEKEPQANMQNMSEEQVLQALSPERRQQMEYGMKLYREHRAELKQKIMNNTKVYEEKELDELGDDQLEKLSQVIKPVGNYSVVSGNAPVQDNAESEEVLLPPGVAEKKE